MPFVKNNFYIYILSKYNLKNKFSHIVVWMMIIGVGFLFQYKFLNEFPSYTHAWAQSDRYALSLGFLDNNFNLFKPQTSVYNHQFPNNWEASSTTSVTAVDFPIHDYVVAILMKLFGNTSPFLFRLYVLLYSFIGIYYLYKLAYAITKEYLKSILIVLFFITSPVYVYYQSGFLPTIPSLSNVIIGLYFYYTSFTSNNQKSFFKSVFFLTLAALSRTTFVIPLVAVCSVEFFRYLKKEIGIRTRLMSVVISFSLLLMYYFYNVYLRKNYGSIFLNYLMPPHSFSEAKELLIQIYNNWRLQYFTIWHYVVFIIGFGLATIFIVFKKPLVQKPNAYFSGFIVLYFLGCCCFAIVMLQQFPAHDYYFLDTFYLPMVLGFAMCLLFLPTISGKLVHLLFILLITGFAIVTIPNVISNQNQRRVAGYWDKTETTIQNFKQAHRFMDSVGVAKDAKILVIDAVAPNIPFLLMQRKGFAVMTTSKENIVNALKWKFDYIVFQNEYFISDIYTPYPDILNRLHKIADNGKISIYTLTQHNPQSLIEFLGLSKSNPILNEEVTFEAPPNILWSNFSQNNKEIFKGNFSGYISPMTDFGLTFKTKYLPQLQEKNHTLIFSSFIKSIIKKDCEIVVSIKCKDKDVFYKSINIKDLLATKYTWQNTTLLFQIPKINTKDYEFSFFIWNTGRGELYVDDFRFMIF